MKNVRYKVKRLHLRNVRHLICIRHMKCFKHPHYRIKYVEPYIPFVVSKVGEREIYKIKCRQKFPSPFCKLCDILTESNVDQNT